MYKKDQQKHAYNNFNENKENVTEKKKLTVTQTSDKQNFESEIVYTIVCSWIYMQFVLLNFIGADWPRWWVYTNEI